MILLLCAYKSECRIEHGYIWNSLTRVWLDRWTIITSSARWGGGSKRSSDQHTTHLGMWLWPHDRPCLWDFAHILSSQLTLKSSRVRRHPHPRGFGIYPLVGACVCVAPLPVLASMMVEYRVLCTYFGSVASHSLCVWVCGSTCVVRCASLLSLLVCDDTWLAEAGPLKGLDPSIQWHSQQVTWLSSLPPLTDRGHHLLSVISQINVLLLMQQKLAKTVACKNRLNESNLAFFRALLWLCRAFWILNCFVRT